MSRRRRARGMDAVAAALRRPGLLVALATAVALALRLYHLGEWSFWIDEAHTFRDATMPLVGEDNFWEKDRAFYPLTFLGLRFLFDVCPGDPGEWLLRLPFALCGAATVPVFWACGRRLVGERAAVLAAWLLALMPWHLFWSQSARGYVFVVLTSTLASGYLCRWVDDRSPGDLARAFVAIGIGALFHPTAIFLALGVVAFVALRRLSGMPLRTRVVAVALAAAALFALPWLASVFPPIQGYVRSKTDASVVHVVVTAGYYFRPVLIVAAAAGFFLLGRRLGRDRALLLACLAAVPLAVLVILGGSLAKGTARYAICSLPAVAWLGAAAVRELAAIGRPGRVRAARIAAGFVGVALFADFGAECWSYNLHRYGDRARWREACDWVVDRFQGERVHVLTVNEPSVTYYFTPEVWATGGAATGPYSVHPLVAWGNRGRWGDGPRRHPPGWRAHLEWQLEQAVADDALLAVLVTRPELEEIDAGQILDAAGDPIDAPGALWRLLHDEFELALYLPCWVGPKDESVWIFLPAGT